jgi:hypothetical protein
VEEAPRGPSKRLNCSCDLKNRRTLLRGAEERLAIERDPVKIVNIVYVMEEAASFFFRRAVNGLRQKRKEMQITEDYERAARIASVAAPYRHARLSAMKLAGDPNNPVRIRDDASMDELRAEMMKHLGILIDGGLIDLEALPVPSRGIANQPNG